MKATPAARIRSRFESLTFHNCLVMSLTYFTNGWQKWLEEHAVEGSNVKAWLDGQPQFDLSSWLAAQPKFDINEFLNPRAPQEGNTSNTSNTSNASLTTWDTMQLLTSQKTTLLKNTAKAVKHFKSLVNALQHTLVRVQAKAAPASTASLAVEDHPPLSFSCQHGGSECAGNAWESCVQDMYPDEAVFFPVVDCIEKRGCAEGEKPVLPGTFAQAGDCFGLPAEVAPGCVADHGRNKMNLAALHQCVFGNTHLKGLQVPRSTILLMQNALATIKLGTSRQWVPWLTINDEPVSKTDDEFNQMFLVGSKVCAIYKEKTVFVSEKRPY